MYNVGVIDAAPLPISVVLTCATTFLEPLVDEVNCQIVSKNQGNNRLIRRQQYTLASFILTLLENPCGLNIEDDGVYASTSSELIGFLSKLALPLDEMLRMSRSLQQHRVVSRWSLAGIAVVAHMVLVKPTPVSRFLMPTVLSASRVLELILPCVVELFQGEAHSVCASKRALHMVSVCLRGDFENTVTLDEDGEHNVETGFKVGQCLVMSCISAQDQVSRTNIWNL